MWIKFHAVVGKITSDSGALIVQGMPPFVYPVLQPPNGGCREGREPWELVEATPTRFARKSETLHKPLNPPEGR